MPRSLAAVFVLLLALPAGGPARAGAPVPGGAWQAAGPAPAINGQVEGIAQRPVTGAINAVVAHPTEAGTLWIAAVNGGLWRSDDATATEPTWTSLTDAMGILSFGALDLDPTDPDHDTLLAGTARTSSFGRVGGARVGLLRSTDGGAGWTVLDGGGQLVGRDAHAVAARGAVLLAATDTGLFRSADAGASFAMVSGGVGSGLPAGRTSDLAGVAGTPARLYVAVTGGSLPGLFRSEDHGAGWVRVSDAAVQSAMAAGGRTRLATGPDGAVFAAVLESAAVGRLAAVFRSGDHGATWTSLGVPTTTEQNGVAIGLHPGGQGHIHFSLAADPEDGNLVYIGGDRQPYFGEGVPGSTQYWPNSLGAEDYTGRLFRGDASQPPGGRWASLTHAGTSNNSAPHADSRAMVFDAGGDLVEVDDGGIYRRTSPRTGNGAWLSANGNLQVTEYHGIAYDGRAGRVIGGAQDTGTTEQQAPGSLVFVSVATADGGDTVVDDHSSPTVSFRYSSFQNLIGFRRRSYDAANNFTGQVFPPRTAIGGSPPMQPQFYTPLAVNAVDGLRLLFGAGNGVYESADQGTTVTRIATVRVNRSAGDPMVYGVPGNPDYVLVGAENALFRRTTAGGALTLVAAFGVSTDWIRDVVVDPADPRRIFVATAGVLRASTDGGASFTTVTGNLPVLGAGELRSLAFVPAAGGGLLVAGGDRGAFASLAQDGFSQWHRLGSGLPRAVVFELHYHPGRDLLVAGLLGRGAWTLEDVSVFDRIFADGFQ